MYTVYAENIATAAPHFLYRVMFAPWSMYTVYAGCLATAEPHFLYRYM
jgi:hypothetical protein